MIQPVLDAILGLLLACVFLLSSVPKLRHPKGFLVATLSYDILSGRAARLYARLVPPLELLLALLLATGTLVRFTALAAGALLFTFAVGVATNIRRGSRIPCGCFGRSGRAVGPGLLVEDLALMAAAAVEAALAGSWIGQEPWSVLRLVGVDQARAGAGAAICVAVAAACSLLLTTVARKERGWRASAARG